MKLVKVDRESVRRTMPKTNVRLMIEEFIDSGNEICEIIFVNGEYRDARVCASTWNTSIRRYGFNTVRAFSKDGHAYIEKIDL